MSSLVQRSKCRVPIAIGAPGLLLLDEKQNPIFYNAEAARILNYSVDSRSEQHRGNSVAAAVRAKLFRRRSANQEAGTVATEIFSDDKRYSWQTFAVFEKTGKRSPGMTGVLIEMNLTERKRPDVPTIAREFRLTDREEETVSHLTFGLTSKEIAARMRVSPNTVKAFLRSIMNKMSVSTRSGILGKLIQH
jgi:DNA-binding CsgD family transcriptional regulator